MVGNIELETSTKRKQEELPHYRQNHSHLIGAPTIHKFNYSYVCPFTFDIFDGLGRITERFRDLNHSSEFKKLLPGYKCHYAQCCTFLLLKRLPLTK